MTVSASNAIHDGADEVAGAELAEVEEVGRGRSPQPQRVDRPAAVADDRAVVGHAEQVRGMAGNGAQHAILQLKRAADRHLDRFPRPDHFPGIGLRQPVVRVFDLEAVLDRLAEDAVLVAQAVAHRRDLQRGQRLDEAGRQPAQAAVAQAGVRLRLDDFLPILPRVRLQVVADELLDPQVDDVVDQRAADQELHRQVVDPLGVFLVVGFLGQQPALGEQIAQRAGDRLEALALAGVLHGDDMIEDQVPVVVVAVRLVGEAELATVVLLQLLRRRCLGHGILSL